MSKSVRATLKSLLQNEQKQLSLVESKLSATNPSLADPHYLQLLSRAALHSSNITLYRNHLRRFGKRYMVRQAFVQAGSQVKLVSTKIGATIWVDAANYAELLGKQLGDVVVMHNSPFEIAGIY